ncbi:MAG: amidohydrolase family protein [Clostridia bacterium]|nr:amidohydrolase family protein [Clostridia bacterium]
MIIDFHTHIFPDKIAKRTIEALEENIARLNIYEGHAVIGGALDDLKKSMTENNIDVSVVLPIATAPHQTNTINKFAAEINGHDGIFSFGSLHPSQENAEEILEGIKAAGLLGIKLHPEYQQSYIDSPECIKILKKCEDLGLYTVLHAGNDIGVAPPVHCAPERLSHVLEYVKGDKIIAAHLGGWQDWDNVEKYLVGTPILLDTAYTVFFIERSQLIRIIKNHGSEKILFATDSPWEAQGKSAEYVRSLELEQGDIDNIMYKNAQKILNLH